MKKFISMLLIIAFAVSFAACGKVEEEPVSPQVPVDILGEGDFVPELPTEGTGNTEATAPAEIQVELTEEQKIKLAEADELVMSNMVDSFFAAATDDWEIPFDEQILRYNFSCYSDSVVTMEQRVVDTPIYWHYDESSVTSEGEPYLPDGLMEGCTLTFYPSQKGDVTVFEVEDIRVNEMVAGAYADPATSTSSKLADIHEDLPEVMRQIFGDEIIIQSPMYRNSCFTIFVNFCGDGSIYGQWSGRNLPATAKQNAQNVQARMDENITSDAFLLGLDTVYVDDYVEAVRRSLADEYIFNELLDYVCTNNVSCYINSDDESVLESERVYFSDSTEEYIFDLGDADWKNVKGIAAGNMTGLTLTGSVSEHDGEMVISTKDIVLNKFIRDKSLVATGRDANTPKYLCGVTPDYEKRGCLYDEEDYGGELFNRLRAIIGESPQICSECYRNSEYTIFIRMTDDPEGLIVVYGQWNGTNIS